MTTLDLRNKITVSFKSYGHYKVTIEYRNKEYSCVTTNTMAVDRMDDDYINHGMFYVSPKQALIALYNECKRKNELK